MSSPQDALNIATATAVLVQALAAALQQHTLQPALQTKVTLLPFWSHDQAARFQNSQLLRPRPSAEPDSLGSRRSLQQSQTHLAHVDPCSRTRLTWLTWIPAAEPDSLGSRGSLQQSQTHLAHVDPCSRTTLTWLTWIPAAEPDSLGSRGSLQQSQTHLAHVDPCSRTRRTWLMWIFA
jgi:hypothetical protein